MGNWIAIQASDVQKAGPIAVVTTAETQQNGATVEAIATATAEVRQALSTGNALDIDPTKVPNSLAKLTARRAFFALCEVLSMELTKDQADTKRNDQSRLNRLVDEKIRVEQPDNPNGTAEMQSQPSPAIRRRHRNFTGRTMDGI